MQRILLLGLVCALLLTTVPLITIAEEIPMPALPNIWLVSASSSVTQNSITIPEYHDIEGYLGAYVNGQGYGASGTAIFEVGQWQWTAYTGSGLVYIEPFSMSDTGTLTANWNSGDAGHNTVQAGLNLMYAD